MQIPLYLSGAIRRELAGRPEFGFMRTPNMGNRAVEGSTWFADNGCFSSKGERAFDLAVYLGWLQAQDSTTCIGATAPDKVGDAYETAKRSLPVLPKLREIGYKASFVAQDGLQLTTSGQLLAVSKADRTEAVPVPWESFDVLFIGGSTEWKLGPMAATITAEAKKHGKWVHMGRVNSFKRYLTAFLMGCDSVDGTFLAFGPAKNLPRLESWVTKLKQIAHKGGNNNENNIPVRGDQRPVGQGCDGLARGCEDGPVGEV